MEPFYFNQRGERMEITGKQYYQMVMVKNGRKPRPITNPLMKYFGPGPAGMKCKDCIHQYFKRYSKSYSKCDLRKKGKHNGASTDHSSRYDACGKFEKKNPDASA